MEVITALDTMVFMPLDGNHFGFEKSDVKIKDG
jgi:hypothetical protein